MMKQEMLFSWQGGPIILVQVIRPLQTCLVYSSIWNQNMIIDWEDFKCCCIRLCLSLAGMIWHAPFCAMLCRVVPMHPVYKNTCPQTHCGMKYIFSLVPTYSISYYISLSNHLHFIDVKHLLISKKRGFWAMPLARMFYRADILLACKKQVNNM